MDFQRVSLGERMNCQCENKHRVDDYEQTTQLPSGQFRTTRVRRSQCPDCSDYWNSKIDMLMVREDQNDGSYGVMYSDLSPEPTDRVYTGLIRTTDQRTEDRRIGHGQYANASGP